MRRMRNAYVRSRGVDVHKRTVTTHFYSLHNMNSYSIFLSCLLPKPNLAYIFSVICQGVPRYGSLVNNLESPVIVEFIGL